MCQSRAAQEPGRAGNLSCCATHSDFFFFFFFAIYYKLMKKANNEQDIKVEQLTYITCRRPASSLVWQPSEGDKKKLINVTKK